MQKETLRNFSGVGNIPGAGVVYRCPRCKCVINNGKDYWCCLDCGETFEIWRGVPILDISDKSRCEVDYQLLRLNSITSGSIPFDDADRFLDQVKEKGWRAALKNAFGSNSTELLRAVACNRVSWEILLNIENSWKILDIGAGTGGAACRLAKKCSVVALDKSRYNSAFMHLRGQQDNLACFEAIVADATHLPFQSNQFDLAIMIGSLEWIPCSWPGKSPRDTQLHSLREAYRVLKPGGKLFLGMENRFFLGYFLGIVEHHTGIKYISLLDREEAEILSQDIRGYSYLELTYSKDESIELLNEAGFENVQAFWLYPDYVFVNHIIPLDNPNIIKYFITKKLNPWEFSGEKEPLYRFYRSLDPLLVGNFVEFFGFLAHRPKQKRGEKE